MGFPGKNTGVCCPALPQGIFPDQGLNPGLLQWQGDSLPLSHQGSPWGCCTLYHLPVTNEETEAQRKQIIYPKSCARIVESDWGLGLSDPKVHPVNLYAVTPSLNNCLWDGYVNVSEGLDRGNEGSWGEPAGVWLYWPIEMPNEGGQCAAVDPWQAANHFFVFL